MAFGYCSVAALWLGCTHGDAATNTEEDAAWIELSDGLESFRAPTGRWVVAGEVSQAAENARRLAWQAGRGVLVNGPNGITNNLVTEQAYGDIELELEFMISRGSNSGVKFAGLYEIQIRDSWQSRRPTGNDCGGVYPRAEQRPGYHHIDRGVAPTKNAARAPGRWQSLHVVFRAPRFDAEGNKLANARFERVELNGELIHEGVEVPTPTGHVWRDAEFPTGPLLLQADHGPVAFRNVRVRPWVEEDAPARE